MRTVRHRLEPRGIHRRGIRSYPARGRNGTATLANRSRPVSARTRLFLFQYRRTRPFTRTCCGLCRLCLARPRATLRNRPWSPGSCSRTGLLSVRMWRRRTRLHQECNRKHEPRRSGPSAPGWRRDRHDDTRTSRWRHAMVCGARGAGDKDQDVRTGHRWWRYNRPATTGTHGTHAGCDGQSHNLHARIGVADPGDLCTVPRTGDSHRDRRCSSGWADTC